MGRTGAGALKVGRGGSTGIGWERGISRVAGGGLNRGALKPPPVGAVSGLWINGVGGATGTCERGTSTAAGDEGANPDPPVDGEAAGLVTLAGGSGGRWDRGTARAGDDGCKPKFPESRCGLSGILSVGGIPGSPVGWDLGGGTLGDPAGGRSPWERGTDSAIPGGIGWGWGRGPGWPPPWCPSPSWS